MEILITDTHLHENNQEENNLVYKKAYQMAKECGLNRVLHGGDVFESRKAQPLKNLSFYRQVLDKIFDKDVKLHVIPGNHDKKDYNSDESYLDPFEHHPHMILYTTPKILDCGAYGIAMLPFFEETGVLLKKMEKVLQMANKYKKPIIGIGHFGVSGVVNNDGTVVENPISPQIFSGFDQIFVGHYHDPSKIPPNIVYPGASMQHRFGEKVNKGICVIHDDFSHKIIKIDNSLEYHNIDIDLSVDNRSDIESKIESCLAKGSNIRYRAIIQGKKEVVDSFDSTFISKMGVKVSKRVTRPNGLDMMEQVGTHDIVMDDKKIIDMWKEFCEKDGMPKSEIMHGLNFFKE